MEALNKTQINEGIKEMRHKKVVFLIAGGIFLFTSMFRSLQAGETGDLIVRAIDKGLNILKDPELQGADKLSERKQRLWDAISPLFNFEEMSKRAMGRYWKDRTAEEKKEFVELFTNLLRDGYLGKTDSYSGEKIVYQREIQDDSRSKVQTTLFTKSGKEISIDFYLLNLNGEWKVYDVIVEGVSLVNNYRSQFNSVLIKSSYAELIKKMREKRQLLTEGS